MNPILRSIVVCAAVTAALAARASACLWDNDTLRAESEGLPDVVDIVVGRFERNPPLYFEVRLARAEQTIAKDPDAFAEYDNAGVACDRLGRGAEAIRWMERKAERMAAQPGNTEHAYRLHANLGTLLAHDWIRRGADRADLSQMKRGRDEIAEAIRINPDAHFGRERIQLAVMDWILDPPPLTNEGEIPDLLGREATGRRDDDGAARGLAGLVALGTAWESVDVFHTLSACVLEHASIRHLADERCEELIRAGRRSMHPAAQTEGAPPKLTWRPGYALRKGQARVVAEWFLGARAAADRWNAEREAYMLPRLREGRHPDWEPDFWRDFEPSPETQPPSQLPIDWAAFWSNVSNQILVALGGIACLVVALVVWRFRRRRQIAAGRSAPRVG